MGCKLHKYRNFNFILIGIINWSRARRGP